MLDGYKHLASSIEETSEKQFASLDIKEKIMALENSMNEEHTFIRDITIKDTSYGLINDIKIQGNTVINLAHDAVWSGSSVAGQLSNMKSSELRLNIKDDTYCQINCYDWKLGASFMIAPITITVIFDVMWVPSTPSLWFAMVDETGAYSYYEMLEKISQGKHRFKYTINPKTAKTLTPRFFSNCMGQTGVGCSVTIKNFCIFEGDVDPITIGEYINGVEAVGSSGTIKLSSCGRNMFNHNLPVVTNKIDVIGENEYKTETDWQTIQNIFLPPNKKFYMSADLKADYYKYAVKENNVMRMDYARGGVVPDSELPKEGTVKTLPTTYARLNSELLYVHNKQCYEKVNILIRNAGIKPLYVKNLMIQEVLTKDDIVHEYEPFVGSNVNIKVKTPLHGLPNGVRDSIELINDEYHIVRRCKEVKLRSHLKWTITQIESSKITRFATKLVDNVRPMRSEIRSNFVPHKRNNTDYATPGIFTSFGLSGNNTPFINVDIPNSLFNNVAPTVEQFGQWLNSGDYRIIVELKNPVIEKMDNQEEIKKLLLFDGVSHIYGYENTVFPITTINIPTNLCAEMDSVESAISILEKEVEKMENISLTTVMGLIDRKEE